MRYRKLDEDASKSTSERLLARMTPRQGREEESG
jgi:hypothetical protein